MSWQNFERNIRYFSDAGRLKSEIDILLKQFKSQPGTLSLTISYDNYVETSFDELKRLPLTDISFSSPKIQNVKNLLDFISRVPNVVLQNPTFDSDDDIELNWDTTNNKKITISQVNNVQKGKINLTLNSSDSKSEIDDILFETSANTTRCKISLKKIRIKRLKCRNFREEAPLLLSLEKGEVSQIDIEGCHKSVLTVDHTTITNMNLKELTGLTYQGVGKSDKSEKFVLRGVDGSISIDNQSFTECVFHLNGGDLQFIDNTSKKLTLSGTLKKLILKSNDIDNIDLNNATIGSANFTGGNLGVSSFQASFGNEMLFRNITFGTAPYFDKKGLCLNSHFINCKYKDFSHDSISKYRSLKNHFIETKNDLDEITFSSLELQARALNIKMKDDPFVKMFSYFYWGFNSFGRSITQPILVLLGSWISFSIIYFMFFDVDLFFERYSMTQIHVFWGEFIFRKDFYRSLLFSFFNSLGPVRYLTNLDFLYIQSVSGKSVSFIQSILSSINLYILVLGVKKRFKQN